MTGSQRRNNAVPVRNWAAAGVSSSGDVSVGVSGGGTLNPLAAAAATRSPLAAAAGDGFGDGGSFRHAHLLSTPSTRKAFAVVSVTGQRDVTASDSLH